MLIVFGRHRGDVPFDLFIEIVFSGISLSTVIYIWDDGGDNLKKVTNQWKKFS